MKLPSFRRLNKTDYEEQYQLLIDKLAASLNIGIESLYDALNGKLSFRDNFNATLTTIGITVDADGVPRTPTQFKLASGQTRISGLLVINVTGADLVSSPFLNFTTNESIVTITKAFGLSPNKTYNITVLGLV